MNRIRYCLGLVLIGVLVAGFQISLFSEVRADGETIPFPNISHTGDVIKWDDISGSVDGMISLYMSETGSDKNSATVNYSKNFTKIDLWEVSKSFSLEAGSYKIIMEADEISGKKYHFESDYELEYHILAGVKNIKLDDKKLTWEFEDPEVADYNDIYFNVSIIVYDVENNKLYSKEYEKVRTTELPSSQFLIKGDYNYVAYIVPDSDVHGYRKSDSSKAGKFRLNLSDLVTVTGLRVDGDFINWDNMPGAAKYDLSFYRKISSTGILYKPTTIPYNSYYMPYDLRGIYYEQDIEVCVAALDEKGNVIGSYASVIYHFSGESAKHFPLYISGEQVSSNMNLANLFGAYGDGRVAYDPSSNKLTFYDFDNDNEFFRYKYKDVLFFSFEDLTVEGNAFFDYSTIIFSPKNIVFEDGCNISAVSDNIPVTAANIQIKGGKLDLKNRGTGEAMFASGTITVNKDCSSVTLESSKEGTPALSAAGLVLDQMMISEPSGGTFNSSKKTVLNSSGTPAPKVKFVHFVPTPTPTATPTSSPAAKPTSGPDNNPSAVSLTLNKNAANIVCGKTLTLKATFTGSSAKIAWTSSDKKIATVDANGKISAKMAGAVTITAAAAGKSATCVVIVLYKDVTKTKDFWFEPTNYLTAKGVVKGYDKQTKFKPANKCTRAQMVTFIWRLMGEPSPKAKTCKFKDVKKKDYFYKACIWGNENKIVEGYKDGTFGPQIVCARRHAVTFLWRLAGQPKPKTTKNPFKDVKKSDYFYKATLWASEKKILAGYSDGTFKPKGDCLRRQMVTFLYKYDKYINKNG
ncbi:MAG: S-layer homology domain-containing protein [Clostridiales bacterium]|nr:S-layer homology domain-containing protein [Clostridiales bacterium]